MIWGNRRDRRREAPQILVLRLKKKKKSCWRTTCRTQNHAAQSDRKKPSEDLAASVFRTSGGGGRGGGGAGAAAEITLRPLSFLLGCLLMCVDIGELHPQSRLRSRCPHYSISFHSPRANKARFFCPATQCAQCACFQRSQCHCKLRVLSSDIQHFRFFLFLPATSSGILVMHHDKKKIIKKCFLSW